MNAVEELQRSLSQLIYSIRDLKSLTKIKSTVDNLIIPTDENSDVPWRKATLVMKNISSFQDVVNSQGNKKLTFDDLSPFIDDSDSNYTVDDLLAALN
jgi:hypothetical protein